MAIPKLRFYHNSGAGLTFLITDPTVENANTGRPMNRALSGFLPGIQQPGDPVFMALKDLPIVFARGLDPFVDSLEEHVVEPVIVVLAKEVLLDGPCNASFR